MTGVALLSFLERRLDNMVFRFGLAASRAEARQLIRHRHFLINGRKVDVPSYLTGPGDQVSVREKSREKAVFKRAVETSERRGVPTWLEFDAEKLIGRIIKLPERSDITVPINERLVVELYSK